MRKLKSLIPLCLFLTLLFTGACSEKAEQVAADETAQQIEAANFGREAAKKIVTKNFKDTLELEKAILEARAQSSKYDVKKEANLKAAFDTAFFNTIQKVRPDLARQLQR